jgi:hypothetical protein
MKHVRKPTIPVAPWEIGDEWDRTPSEPAIEQARKTLPKKKPVIHTKSTEQCTPIHAVIGRTFMGNLNVSDLKYIAMAVLQLSDENHELRERVRRLEEGALK